MRSKKPGTPPDNRLWSVHMDEEEGNLLSNVHLGTIQSGIPPLYSVGWCQPQVNIWFRFRELQSFAATDRKIPTNLNPMTTGI